MATALDKARDAGFGPGNPSPEQITKPCMTCGLDKNLLAYWRDKRRPDGRLSECKLCGRARNTRWFREHRDQARAINARATKKARQSPDKYLHRMLISARSRARKKGLEFSITEADLTIPEVCPVLGIPLVAGLPRGPSGWNDNAPSLDRIDNSKGYVPGNVVIVSNRVNALKSDASLAELKAIAAFYGGFDAGD